MVAIILTKAVIGFRSKMEDEYLCRMVETAKPALVCLAFLYYYYFLLLLLLSLLLLLFSINLILVSAFFIHLILLTYNFQLYSFLI